MVLSAYANDVVVFVKDQQDVDAVLTVNWGKSEALAVPVQQAWCGRP